MLQELTDEELLNLSLKNDVRGRKAFEILFYRHSSKLIHYIRNRLGNSFSENTWKDILHQAFISAREKAERQKEFEISFQAYMFGTIRNMCADTVKEFSRYGAKKLEDLNTSEEIKAILFFDEPLEEKQTTKIRNYFKKLEVALNLSSNERRYIQYALDGIQNQEIASMLKLSPASITNTINRIKEKVEKNKKLVNKLYYEEFGQ